MSAEYGLDLFEMPTSLNTNGSSLVWRGIVATWHYVLRGLKWLVGDGGKGTFFGWILGLVSWVRYYIMQP